MKNLMSEFKRSLWKSDIYEKPEANRLSRAIRYIALLLIIVSAVEAIVLGAFSVPAMKNLKALALDAVAKYPAGLTLTLSKGVLSMNKPGPLAIKPEALASTTSKYENMVVIDPSHDLDFSSFASYKTAILVARNGYMSIDKNNTYKAAMFSSYPDMTIDNAKVADIGKKIASVSPFIYLFALMIALMAFVGIYAVSFIAAMAFAFVGILAVLIVSRTKGHRLNFEQLYALSLYAYTVAILANILKLIFGFGNWVALAAFVVLLAVLVKNVRPAKAAPAA